MERTRSGDPVAPIRPLENRSGEAAGYSNFRADAIEHEWILSRFAH
jgi:hypothetical protein